MLELRIEGLSKTYPNGVKALQDVSLTIPTGMFGLLGPNGAGKSTLMRTIATLQEADAGSISLGDSALGNIDVLREKDKVRRLLGYLPQEFGVYPRISAVIHAIKICSLRPKHTSMQTNSNNDQCECELQVTRSDASPQRK